MCSHAQTDRKGKGKEQQNRRKLKIKQKSKLLQLGLGASTDNPSSPEPVHLPQGWFLYSSGELQEEGGRRSRMRRRIAPRPDDSVNDNQLWGEILNPDGGTHREPIRQG